MSRSQVMTSCRRQERVGSCLSQDVTRASAPAAELSVAHDAAVEASTLKSAFLANISHEMRTPMNGVLGMNGLLLATHLTDEQAQVRRRRSSRSAEEMMAIIDRRARCGENRGRRDPARSDGLFRCARPLSGHVPSGHVRLPPRAWRSSSASDDAVPQRAHGDDLRLRADRCEARLECCHVHGGRVGRGFT